MKAPLRKDYFWNTIGIFAQNAISPLLIIVITRMNGIDDSGMFSFAFAVSIIFWTIGMWGGRTYQVSDVKKEFSSKSYITVRLILAIGMLIGIVLFVVANNYDTEKTGLLIVLVAFKVVESIADAVYGVLQVHNRLFTVGKSLLYKASLGFIAFLALDMVTKSIFVGSIGIVVVNTLILLFYDIRIARQQEDIWIKKKDIHSNIVGAITIMRRCAPVFAVFFLIVFSLNIPRYFIDMFYKEQIGYFGILAMPITLIALVMSFILQPNIVQLSNYYANGNYGKFRKIVARLILITVCIGVAILIVTYLIGTPVLNIVFGISFDAYRTALLIMVAGGIINALVSIYINILVVMRRFKSQFYILVCTNVLLVILSLVFVKLFGLIAGVILFALINLLQVILMAATYNASFRVKSPQ